jgi:hypothetical protein
MTSQQEADALLREWQESRLESLESRISRLERFVVSACRSNGWCDSCAEKNSSCASEIVEEIEDEIKGRRLYNEERE